MPRLGPVPTRRDLLAIVALLLIVALVLGLPNPMSDTVREQRADAAAVEEARASVEAVAAEIAARPDLDPATRTLMTERLDDLLAALDPGSVTREDAAADIAAAEADIRRLDTGAADAQAAALRNAAPILQTSGATANLGNALAAGDLTAASDAMAALGEESQALSPEEQQALANRLNEMAAQQQDANPEFASALAAAAAALASGNPSQASASLQQATAAIKAVADAQAATSAAATARSALANTRQALGTPGRAGSSTSAAGGTPRAGSGQGGSGSASGTPQAGDGSSSSSGSSSGSGTPSAGGGRSNSAGGNMSLSGQVAGSSARTTAGGTSSGNGQPRQGEEGVTGTRDEEPIYAPSTQTGAQGPDEFIAGIEGPGNEETSAQSGTGLATESQVPYATVYGEYERQAARDLEQGAVPAPLQPYVRDYFSALEPGSGGASEDDQP